MILGIIPARGGSKGIPRKNIRPICGKPVIAWSIESAQKSKLLDDFVVSTEDDEISRISRSYGARVLDRPSQLATDESTTLSVIQHAISEINADLVVVLQPTSPIRDDDLIDRCIQHLRDTKADCIATGSICTLKEYGTHDNKRRQDTPGFFRDDGNIYVIKSDLIKSGKWTSENMERLVLEDDQCCEIDTEDELFIVDKLLERRVINKIKSIDSDIKLLVCDVDGVLTDGGISYSPDGERLKKFNTRDGMGIELLHQQGIPTAFLTKENSPIVAERAKKLNIPHLFMGVQDKVKVLQEALVELNLQWEQVAFIGDDVNDTGLLAKVGFSACPGDAIDANKMIANYVCRLKGGEGCVREVCDLLLAAKNDLATTV